MNTSAPPSAIDIQSRLSRTPVSPRARALLAATYVQLEKALANPFKLTVVELERELFKKAERARNSQIQGDLYAEMQRLRDNVDRFAPAMFDGIANDLVQLCEPRQAEPQTPSTQSGNFQALTLVQDNDIDRDILLHDVSRKEAARSANGLHLLCQRLAVLARAPQFELEQVPLGPHVLCRVLREVGDHLGLGLDSQLVLYRVFEQQVLDRYSEVLERLNILLAHEGILPGLVYIPYVPRPQAPRKRGHAHGETDDANQRGKRPPGGARPLTGWSGQAPGQAWATAMSAMLEPAQELAQEQAGAAMTASNDDPGMPAADALHQLLSSARARQAAAAGTGSSAMPGTTGPTTPASPLSTGTSLPASMLSGSDQPGGQIVTGDPGPADAAAAITQPPAAAAPQPVQPAAIQSALGALQPAAPPVAAASPGSPRRSIADLHRQVLQNLRAEHGQQAALSQQDTDTFDLLDLLYGQIDREVRKTSSAADLLVKLQVPLIRSALQDPAFFVRDQHPARELLNAVAESGATWLAEDDTDPTLLQKLGKAVDKVVHDFQGDEQVFADANEEIQSHYKALARKAEVAERRQVEAARGKERLAMAKQLVGRTIEQATAEDAPPKFVQTLMSQAWSDVLTLTLLRQGEQSEEWHERQRETERIVEITRANEGETDTALADNVEQALLQVGYHKDEAGAISRRLATPGGEDAASSRTELAAKLKARSRLGKQGEQERREPVAPRTEAEQAAFDQLRTLPFGTWFEFVTNQQGDARRQRLSWYSLVTEHALFVNSRGQKVGEQSLDQLARLMAHGQVRIVTEDRGRLIDRAWQATVRALRTLAGGSGNPAPTAEAAGAPS